VKRNNGNYSITSLGNSFLNLDINKTFAIFSEMQSRQENTDITSMLESPSRRVLAVDDEAGIIFYIIPPHSSNRRWLEQLMCRQNNTM